MFYRGLKTAENMLIWSIQTRQHLRQDRKVWTLSCGKGHCLVGSNRQRASPWHNRSIFRLVYLLGSLRPISPHRVSNVKAELPRTSFYEYIVHIRSPYPLRLPLIVYPCFTRISRIGPFLAIVVFCGLAKIQPCGVLEGERAGTAKARPFSSCPAMHAPRIVAGKEFCVPFQVAAALFSPSLSLLDVL